MVCEFNGFLCDLDGRDLVAHCENRNIQLFTDYLQLLDCSGTVDVACNEQRAFALLFIHSRELTCVGGFTCTLKTDHHNNCGGLGCNGELGLRAAHQTRELFVYNLDDLLGRKQGFENFGTDCTLGNDFDKVTNYLEVNVSLEQCELDLAHTRLNVGFGKLTLVTKFFKGVV